MTGSGTDTPRAVEWMCPNCGDEVDNGEECESWDCVYCGETMVPKDKADVTPNDALRELIEEWRDRVEEHSSAYHQSDVPVLLDELEEVIGDG